MEKLDSLDDALQLGILLHGPFTASQLDTEQSRFSLFTQLEELYWHITDEYHGKGSQISQLDLYVLFFERTAKTWGGHHPSRSTISGWLHDYTSHIKNIPVCGALILNNTMDKILLSGSTFEKTTIFTPPRGKRNEGETPENTAIREVAEETGLDIAPFLIPDEFVKFRQSQTTRTIQLFVVVTPLTGNETIPVPKRPDNHKRNNEVSVSSWFPLFESRILVTRTTSVALHLLMDWCHSKILNPASNKKATANVLLRPIQSVTGKQYHFDPRALSGQKVQYPSVYTIVKTYSAVCAGLLSVNFCQVLPAMHSPYYSTGPRSVESFDDGYGYNTTPQHSSDARPRASSNSRRTSPQRDHLLNGNNNNTTNHSTSSTTPSHGNSNSNSTAKSLSSVQLAAAPAINLNELFAMQVSLDDVFAEPNSAVATAAPPQHISSAISTGQSSPQSSAMIADTTSTKSIPSTPITHHTTSSTQPSSRQTPHLGHLVAPNVSSAAAGQSPQPQPTVPSPTPSLTSTTRQSAHGTTLPGASTTLASPVDTSSLKFITNPIPPPSSVNTLANLKMKLKNPATPLQPLAPK